MAKSLQKFALVLFDMHGETSIISTQKLTSPSTIKLASRPHLQMRGRKYLVEVLELSDKSEDLKKEQEKWSKSHRAIAIEKRIKRDGNKVTGGFLNIWPDGENEENAPPQSNKPVRKPLGLKRPAISTLNRKTVKKPRVTSLPVKEKSSKFPYLMTGSNGRKINVLYEGSGDYTDYVATPKRNPVFLETLSKDEQDMVRQQVEAHQSGQRSIGVQTDSVVILSSDHDVNKWLEYMQRSSTDLEPNQPVDPEPEPNQPEDPEPEPNQPVDPEPEPNQPVDPEPNQPEPNQPVDPEELIQPVDQEPELIQPTDPEPVYPSPTRPIYPLSPVVEVRPPRSHHNDNTIHEKLDIIIKMLQDRKEHRQSFDISSFLQNITVHDEVSEVKQPPITKFYTAKPTTIQLPAKGPSCTDLLLEFEEFTLPMREETTDLPPPPPPHASDLPAPPLHSTYMPPPHASDFPLPPSASTDLPPSASTDLPPPASTDLPTPGSTDFLPPQSTDLSPPPSTDLPTTERPLHVLSTSSTRTLQPCNPGPIVEIDSFKDVACLRESGTELRVRYQAMFPLKENSCSVQNFSWKLARQLYTADDLVGRNYRGRKGKVPLSPRRKHAIEHTISDMYGPDSLLTGINAINCGIRNMGRKHPKK